MNEMTRVAEVARLIHDDSKQDAARLDRTPVTPRGIGETLGTQLAMIAQLAKCVERLAKELE